MTRQRFVSTLLVLTVSLFGTVPAPLSANPAMVGGAVSAGIGQITYVEGRVDRHSGDDYFPVVRQENISVGDTIRTKSYSRAEIVFSDKSVLRIGENTQVQVRDFSQENSGKAPKGSLFVDRGKVRVILPEGQKSGSHFQFETPNSKGDLKGSDLGVSYLKSATSIMALSGEVSAKNINFPDKEIHVAGGNTAYVPYDAPPAAPRPFLKIEKKKFEAETSPAPVTPDQGKIRKAIVGKFIGEVRVRTKGAAEWHSPAVKEALGAGDEIETGEGKVQLILESGREIYLKENTHIKVKSLTRDPKTGTLEDVLESKLGAIRAKIDKKKEGSKFEIHSPIAVAAVRGTILYFFIDKNASTSFFEQGNGTLASLIKKASINIAAGQFGSVDEKGDVHGPSETNTAKLDEIERGWDIPDNTYGYSAPPGSLDVDYEEPQDPLDQSEDGETDNPFEEIKPDIGTSGGGDSELPLQVFGTWGGGDGSLYSNNSGSFQWRGEERGYIMASVFPWTSPQAFVLASTEFFDTSEGQRNLLFNSFISSRVYDRALNPEGVQSTSDGGAFYGFTAGLWSGVEGTLVALFVDPNKNVGVLTGNVNGQPNAAAGTFEANGFLQPSVFGTFPDINPDYFTEYIEYGEGEGYLYGDFDSDSFLEGSSNRMETMFLVDESRENFPSLDFGIYNLGFGGTFYKPELADTWNAKAGGWAQFGFYVPLESYCWKDDEGYWLAELGGTWADGEIRGNLIGAFLTKTHLGVLGGEVTGLYDDYSEFSSFIVQSIGVFQSAPLAFFSRLGGTSYDVFNESDGEFEAYWGGVESVLTDGGTADVFVIGNMETDSYSQIWRDDIKSYNAIERNKTTYDGGAYYGYAAGNNVYGTMKGGFVGIYLAPAEEGSWAGLITGNLEGEFIESLDMFSMEGTLSSRAKELVDIDAGDLQIRTTGGRGRLTGSFEGQEGPEGFIAGLDNFQTASLVDYENGYAANWGIYQQSFDRTGFSQPAGLTEWSGYMGGNDAFGFYVTDYEGYDFEDDYGFWIADITDGTFENGEVDARLSGRFLTYTKVGTLEGDIYGIYEYGEYSAWNAYGLGTWEGRDLDFAGRVLGEGGHFAYYDGEGFDSFGSVYGTLLGGLGDLGAESQILLMGEYNFNTEEAAVPTLFGLEVASYSVYDEAPLTFSGDAFWGFAGGRFSNGQVNGAARMIYILRGEGESPNTAGVISGDLNGSYYEFSEQDGMWLAEGEFTAIQKTDNTNGISPEDLNDNEYGAVQEREFYAQGYSSISGDGNLFVDLSGEGEFANLENADWGIWAGFIEGDYFSDSEIERGTDFRTAFGGATEIYEGQGEEYPIYFFGTVDGTFSNSDEDSGDVEAAASGVWISETGQQEQFVRVGVIEGQASGFFSGEGSGGGLQMAAVGDWTGVTNLNAAAINLGQIQDILANSAISEIANTLAVGTGNFNGEQESITGTMNASFFSGGEGGGIWSALFNGSFSGLPGEVSSWNAVFNGPGELPVTATLTGLNWSDGQWLANVNGTLGTEQLFFGQAGGSYTTSETDPNSGTFSGVGVGTTGCNCA